MKTDPATNPLDKIPPILKKNLDRNLCVCNEVLKIDIINAILNGAKTVGEIKKQTYATMRFIGFAECWMAAVIRFIWRGVWCA